MNGAIGHPGGHVAASRTLFVAPDADVTAARDGMLPAAAFGPGGFDRDAPRTRLLDGSTRLRRDGGELASCSNQSGMRLGGRQPAQGPRPVYEVDVGDMCCLWRGAPLEDIEHAQGDRQKESECKSFHVEAERSS